MRSQKLLLVVMGVSLVTLLWIQGPKFGDEFRIDEDFRSFYWMRKFRNPSLFPNDQLRSDRYINVSTSRGEIPISIYSPGYGLLFYVASVFVTPILFNKLLPFLLLVVLVWYLFKYGESVKDARMGATLAIGFLVINLISTTSLSVSAGLQRSFALPLMIALIYHLNRRQYGASAIVLVLSALIYPPVVVLVSITWGLFIFDLNPEEGKLLSISGRGFRLLLLACLISTPILFSMLTSDFVQGPSDRSSTATADAEGETRPVWQQTKYSAGGRNPLFDVFPVVGRAGLVTKPLDALHLFLLTLLSVFVVLIRGRRALELPSEIWCVLGGGALSFALSWASILILDSFLLYFPSRFGRASLFLFVPMFVLLNGEEFLEDSIAYVQRHRDKLAWVVIGVEVVVVSIVVFYPPERSTLNGFNLKRVLVPAAVTLGILTALTIRRMSGLVFNLSGSGRSLVGRALIASVGVLALVGWLAYARAVSTISLLNPSAAERDTLAFVETLPEDSLIAGTPCALDNVPLFSGRQILFSCEKISRDSELTLVALNAYYSNDVQEVVDFCDRYGVDYLVIELTAYSKARIAAGEVFFEPYNELLLADIADQDSFVLSEVAEEVSVFGSGSYRVIPCGALTTVDS